MDQLQLLFRKVGFSMSDWNKCFGFKLMMIDCVTRVMAEYEIWEPLQCKSVFNTYLSLGRSNQKVEESGLAFFWPNWSSSDLPNPNTNTQIHKHTNTQIQHITKCQKDPPCGIFLKRGLFKDVKNDIPMCQKRKYKNTNTKIHKYTNTA